ncbi:2-hydroxyacid dehydrogenase [Paracoccus pacificus]|uniref:2-hydroxyacid dehydrogenase n=1 Tax=Paracoccus pacificus TaxID=1463598 RepID=A0ABW4RA87_9RHOB
MRLLITRRMTGAVETAAQGRYDTTIRDSEIPLTASEAAAAMAEYDVIMPTLGDAFTAEAFKGDPARCRMLANFGAGYNHIDIAAARAAGIDVTNTPDAVTDATADIAMTLILMTARRAGEGERLVRSGAWKGWTPTFMLGQHVSGKVLGVLGMGRIGKAIARRAHLGFGMDVVFFNRSTVSALDIPARQMDMDAVLQTADFVVVALPGGTATHHMIGAEQIAKMRRNAVLINIARGDIVDEAALIAALQENRIAGAGLDVFEREPQIPESLLALENAVLLPHLGTATEQTRTEMGMRALANIQAFAENRAPRDRVN